MKLLARLRGDATPPPSPARDNAAAIPQPVYGRPPVTGSADLNRVVALPRRTLTLDPAARRDLEQRLRITGRACVCAQQNRPCPTELLPIQAQALLEAERARGLFAPIGVGHGKTLIDLLLPTVLGVQRAVLLIPANLRTQLLERDWPYYGGHWRLPNLAGGRWFEAGRPTLHVITYNILSRPESSDLLKRIDPQVIICDEAHNLKGPKSARTLRFLRYFEHAPQTMNCDLSGTFASRSIKDCAHLGAISLGDGSPYPHDPRTVDEWAGALDPSDLVAHPGALQRLCDPGEDVRDGFRRRRNSTLGVVSTSESAIGTSLVIRRRHVGTVPKQLLGYIAMALEGERPDGERFQEPMQGAACARQLSAGFYHRWRYPRMEPPKLIDEWFAKRKAWNSEVWNELRHPEEHLDSPGLLMKAAIRAHQDPPYDGDKPVWHAINWPAWRDIHDQVRPVPEAVWLEDFVAEDAAAWAQETVGIVWVEFPELGERIARAAGVPYYGGGPDASDLILRETGKRSIVASIKAHGTGKNLQRFSRNLIVNPPADGATWEQLIARTHRPMQEADEVEVEVMLHTGPYRSAFRRAREFARFIQQSDGQPQKLLMAAYEFDPDA